MNDRITQYQSPPCLLHELEPEMDVRIKRIYDKPARADGFRVLVDGLWPRGIRKEDAALDQWARELAPSTPRCASVRHWSA